VTELSWKQFGGDTHCTMTWKTRRKTEKTGKHILRNQSDEEKWNELARNIV
jgi:hypothetical protein